MKKVLSFVKTKDIPTLALWVLALLLVAGKVFLCSYQLMLASPDLSPIDDTLMFDLANNIVAGKWLGEYNYLTLGKHSFFALWLAGVHLLGINYIVAGQLLFAFACLVLLAAVKPLFKTNVARFFVFGIVLFTPASWAEFTLRVYRDNIYPSLVLLAFAALLGALVRYKEPIQKPIGFYILAGLGFGTAWLTHEDNALLLPFIGCAVLFFLLVLWLSKDVTKKAAKTAMLAVPLTIYAVCILSWCGMNYKYYGRFIVSDFTSSEFNDAMGALLRTFPDDQIRYLPLPNTSRDALYEISPTFASIQEELEHKDIYNSFGSVEEEEIYASALHWAIRRAAGNAGYYTDAATAEAFYKQVAEEVNAACDAGLIPASKKYSGTFAPFQFSYVKPTLQFFTEEVRVFVFFEQTEPTTVLSIARPDQSEEWETFLHCESTKIAIENTDDPYYFPNNQRAYFCLNIATWVQRILVWPMLLLALLWVVRFCKQTFAFLKKKTPLPSNWLGGLLLFGFFLSAVLRMAAVAYLFAFSIRIDVYLMYLAPACSLMLAFLASASAWCFESWREKT